MTPTFDEPSHTYTLDGVRIPSVTQILSFGQDLSRIPEWTSLRGTAFHLCTEWDDDGTLDESSVDPMVRPHLDAYRAWKRATRPLFLDTEIRVWGDIDGLRFAGTIDRVYAGPRNKPALLDLKSGQPRKDHGAQLAAYAVAYEQQMQDAIVETKGVYCTKEGMFAERPYNGREYLEMFTTKLHRYYEEAK